jgi:large subunit ribosomal protein L24
MIKKVHVKTGDTVVVINGKNRGKQGKVMQVSPKEGKVIVEGVNMVTKHVKPRQMGEPGGLIKAEASINAVSPSPIEEGGDEPPAQEEPPVEGEVQES